MLLPSYRFHEVEQLGGDSRRCLIRIAQLVVARLRLSLQLHRRPNLPRENHQVFEQTALHVRVGDVVEPTAVQVHFDNRLDVHRLALRHRHLLHLRLRVLLLLVLWLLVLTLSLRSGKTYGCLGKLTSIKFVRRRRRSPTLVDRSHKLIESFVKLDELRREHAQLLL